MAEAAPAPVLPESTGKTAASPPPTPPEFAERLKAAGAKTGDVQLTLIWFNVNDLDLHCVEPGGERIFFGHRRSRTGGQLDVDANAGIAITNRPVENIYWPVGKVPIGTYRVFLHHFANHGGADPTTYKVSVLVGGVRKEFQGMISRGQPIRLIYTFNVRPEDLGGVPAGPELRVGVSPKPSVEQGAQNKLKVRVQRDKFNGPVTCRLGGSLAGLTAAPFVIPDGVNEASWQIAADASAAAGPHAMSVVATCEKHVATAKFQLTVTEPPPDLRLAVSPEMAISQGASNRLQIRIARFRLAGPVLVRLEGNVAGLSRCVVTFGAEENEKTLEIAATADAAPGERKLVAPRRRLLPTPSSCHPRPTFA